MVGLLIKDIRLLFGQKKFFIVVILISVLFVISGQNPMFAVNYSTLLCAFFTISTISYDEFNHGFSFLFTLPISRKGYVLEKYLYGLIVGGIAWLATTILGAGYNSLTGAPVMMSEWLEAAVGTLLGLGGFLCVTLPVQFKYGVEKGRTALFIVMLVIFGGMGFLMKNEKLLPVLQAKLQWIQGIEGTTALWAGVFAFALVAAASILISIRIVEKKQF